MISYEIREINLDDDIISNEISLLLGDAYDCASIPIKSVIRNTKTNSAKPSLYLAAILENKVIGFNAFISHELYLNKTVITCYQSCWTATSSEHRGKKVFQNLILTAHDILKERGAAFVFGFPNDNSYPLFTKKLKYREIPSLKWQMPNILGIRWSWYNPHPKSLEYLKQDAVLQNDPQLVDLKFKELGDNLVKAEFEGSLVWGVRRLTVRKGISVPYFDIGGFDLVHSSHLPRLINLLRHSTNFVAYFQLVTVANNSFNGLLRRVETSTSNCLIVYDLNLETSKGIDLNFFAGLRDVFK